MAAAGQLDGAIDQPSRLDWIRMNFLCCHSLCTFVNFLWVNIYQSVQVLEDFQPWLDRVVHFPEEVVHEAQKQIPPEWLTGDADVLRAILAKLMSRRRRVPDLICDSRGAH
jgi:hypothetical protein